MGLEYNPATGKFEETGGGGSSYDPQFDNIGGGYMQDRRTGAFYRQDAAGTRIPVDSSEIRAYEDRVASTPRVSFSSSQSLADPRELELAYARLDQERQATDQRLAHDNAQLAFLREKLEIEVREGQADRANVTRQLEEQVRARVEGNELRRTEILDQQRRFDAEMAFNKAQAERQSQMEAARFNQEERRFQEESRLARVNAQRQIANDIAGYAQNPGSIGAQAAFLQAGKSASPVSTFMGEGGTAITDESLRPLEMLLRSQDALNAAPRASIPTDVAMRDDRPWATAEFNSLGREAQDTVRNQWLANVNTAATEQGLTLDEAYQRGTPGVDRQGGATGNVTNWHEADVVYAANGFSGVVDEPTIFVAGEGGQPETVNVEPTTTDRARKFLNEAARRALMTSGFGSVPTPVGLSAPGTNPYLREVGGSLAAITRGIDPRLFHYEAEQSRPTGLSGAPMRRTR